MKVEEVKQITNQALEELAASLESGQSQTLTAYLKIMALFSKYSLNNLFLIARQRPDRSPRRWISDFAEVGSLRSQG